MRTLKTLLIASLVAGISPLAAHAASTPLPATIAPDVAAVQSACSQLRYDAVLLDISRASNDAAGVSSNLGAVKNDQTMLVNALQTLGLAADAYLQPSLDALSAADTAYQAAFTQLRSDVTANPGALTTDKANLLSAFNAQEAARVQVLANRQALTAAGAMNGCMDGSTMSGGYGYATGMGSGRGSSGMGGYGTGGMGGASGGGTGGMMSGAGSSGNTGGMGGGMRR